MANPTPEPAASPPVGERAVRRIANLIPILGIAAGLMAGILRHWDWAAGLVLGSGLAWLNFRWLKRGLEAFTAGAARTGTEKPRASAATYLAAIFRYALIGLAVYVIFNYLHVPLVSIVLGLCAFAVATIAVSVLEILQASE